MGQWIYLAGEGGVAGAVEARHVRERHGHGEHA